MLYSCTFISCVQDRLEWLSSQQQTRASHGGYRSPKWSLLPHSQVYSVPSFMSFQMNSYIALATDEVHFVENCPFCLYSWII